VNRSILPILGALAVLLGACSAAASPAGESGPPALPGAAATAFLAHELVDVRSGERFTLGQLAAEKPVLVETMAVWCTTCLAQQREVVKAHAIGDFHSVGIDVDPNERAESLADYANGEGFDWRYAMADAVLVKLLTDAYGFAVTNPPSTPTFVIMTDGTVRALEFGRVRSAEELVAELTAG
jgi:thiol-disulfide isomerase/thioredoxin